MRIVGYARVSTLAQSSTEPALEQQVARLRAAGCSEIFQDIYSGTKDKRPEFQRLMDLVKNRGVTEVVITRLDRLSRSLPTLRATIDLFQKAGVNLRALDDNLDLTTAAGKFHVNMLGALAEMESDRMSERIKHGHAHSRAQLKAHHPPFGYVTINAKHELDRAISICLLSERSEHSYCDLAREIVDSYLREQSLNKVVREFSRRWGWTPFNASALGRWLKSPTLRGNLVYFPKSKNPQIHLDTHEALITQEEAGEIDRTLQINHRIGGFGATRGRYPLTGLIRCLECGAGCVVANGSKGRVQYWKCHKFMSGICTQRKGVRTEVVEAAVIDALVERSESLTDFTSTDAPKPQPKEVQELMEQLSQLEAIPGSNPAIALAMADIRRQLQNLATTEVISEVRVSADREYLKQFFSEFGSEFLKWAPTEDRRAIFRRFVHSVEVRNGEVAKVNLSL